MRPMAINEEIAPSQIEGLLARAERAEDEVSQSEILIVASGLYEAQAQTDHAFIVRCTAYRVKPGAAARAELERLAALTGRLAELEALLAETTPSLPLDERASALCDLGRLRLRKLRAPDRALEALDTALALQPSAEAIALRADALEELGRWSELATVLPGMIESAATKEESARLLGRLADVLERGVGDAAAAEEVCHRALAIDPTLTAVRARLERLVRTRGDLSGLLRLVDAQMVVTPLEQQEPLLREAAELCERMGRSAEAAERYEELRRRHPGELGPLRALERIYSADGKLRKQISVLEELVGLVESKREHAGFHEKLAAAWTELGEPARAIESYEWLHAYDPTEPAFRALEKLYRAEQRWGALADAYARQLHAADAASRRPLAVELAALYEEKLHDPGQAIACWQTTLDEHAEDVEALEALARLCEQLDDFERACAMNERRAALARDGQQRARRLSIAARCAARLEDQARAHRLFERAFDADPAFLPARLALAASHRRRGELHRAAELIGAALASADKDDAALLYELAALKEAQGDLEGAFEQYRALLERAPDPLETRRRAAALALRLGKHGDALKLAAPLPDEGAIEPRVERWLLVARAAHAAGDRSLSQTAARRATELAPERLDVRRLQAELLLADGKVAEAEALVKAMASEREAMSLAERTAHAFLAGECARVRGDRAAALAHYHEAVAFDPTHRQALRQALDLSVELERWRDALGALASLVAIEHDPRLRARYRHLAGHICEESLGDLDDALAHYRAALADDPDAERTAERIEALFRQRGDWAGLAEYCARALERLGERGAVEARARLWCILADAAVGLGDRDGTIAALEVVARLDPRQYEARRRLAALYLQSGPDAADKAIAAQHAVLALDASHVPSYRALAALYESVGEIARAEACTKAAELLTSTERAWTPSPELASKPLTQADWAALRHPDEDRYLSLLASLVTPLLAASAATPLDRVGHAVARNDTRPFVQAIDYVVRTFGIAPPELFTASEQMAPLRFVCGAAKQAVRPAFVAGLPLLGDRRRMPDLVPSVALDLAQLRPERSLRLLVHDPAVLAVVIRAAIAVAHDEEPSPDAKLTAAALKRWLSPVALDQVGVVGRRLRQEGREPLALAAAWLRAADLTAARATLVLTGDLPRTIAAVEARAADGNAARDATRELIWSSVTDELWSVRKRIV